MFQNAANLNGTLPRYGAGLGLPTTSVVAVEKGPSIGKKNKARDHTHLDDKKISTTDRHYFMISISLSSYIIITKSFLSFVRGRGRARASPSGPRLPPRGARPQTLTVNLLSPTIQYNDGHSDTGGQDSETETATKLTQ